MSAPLADDDYPGWKRAIERVPSFELKLIPQRSHTLWYLSWVVTDSRGRRQRRLAWGQLKWTTRGKVPRTLLNELRRALRAVEHHYEPPAREAAPRSPRGGYGGDQPLPGMSGETEDASHRSERGLPY